MPIRPITNQQAVNRPRLLNMNAMPLRLVLRQTTFNWLAKNIITALSNSQRIMTKPVAMVLIELDPM